MGAQSNVARSAHDLPVAPDPDLIHCHALPIHLHPTAPLAERVLLPGDPGRALLLAQALLEAPAMFNHHRGLWGYTGPASDGQPLTIQSTGMGGPSSAIVIAELAELGAHRLMRVGTCGGLVPALGLGDLLIATEALPEDGTSRTLGASGPLSPDPQLTRALRAAAGEGVHTGPVVATDLFYDIPPGAEEQWIDAGALAVDMETATLFALAQRRSIRAASLLLVSDLLANHARISEEDLRAGEAALGDVAMSALAAMESEESPSVSTSR